MALNLIEDVQNLEEVQPLGLLPDGTEANLSIISVKRSPSKSNPQNTDQLTVEFAVLDHDTFPITEYIGLPQEHHDQSTADKKRRGLKRFAAAFDFDLSELAAALETRNESGEYAPDMTYFAGQTCYNILRVEAGTNGFKDKNRIGRWVKAQ